MEASAQLVSPPSGAQAQDAGDLPGSGSTPEALPPVAAALVAAVRDERWSDLGGLLLAVATPLSDAAATRRVEDVSGYEQALAFASRQLRRHAGAAGDHPAYLLGQSDALLNLSARAVDRGVSRALVDQVRRRAPVLRVLDALVRLGESQQSDLAQACGMAPNGLSNILPWMEQHDLVRRARIGRYTQIMLGPRGEIVWRAASNPA
ncbi:MAG: hypothetical protein ACKOWF_20080 [Chloroflexota bacterium]